MAAAIFLAPMPLGANRPWAWSLLSTLVFSAIAVFLITSRQSVWPALKQQQLVVVLLLAFAGIPLLQMVPLPLSVAQLFAPGAVDAWALIGRNDFVPVSIDVALTADFGLRQAAALLLAIVMLSLFRHRAVRWQFVNVLVAVALINAVIGLWAFLSGKPMTGTYVNKNHFAGLLSMVLPLAVAAAIRCWRDSTQQVGATVTDYRFFAWVGAILVLSLALVLSGSRGGVMASFVALMLTLFVFVGPGRQRRRLLVGLVAGILVMGVVVGLLMGDDAMLRSYLRGVSERPLQWADTLRLVPDFWLLGSGVGTYNYAYPAIKSPELGFVRFDHAHNDYLEILVTMGVIGLLLFMVSVVVVFSQVLRPAVLRRGLAHNALAFGAAWSVAAGLAHAAVDFNLQIPANFLIFFLVLMLLASTARGRSRQRTSVSNADPASVGRTPGNDAALSNVHQRVPHGPPTTLT